MNIDGWKERLLAAMKERDISPRAVSLKSGHGGGYVHSLLKEGKDPSIVHLFEVCAAIGVSPAYVLFGVDISPKTVELMRRMEKDPGVAQAVLQLLEAKGQG